MSHNSLIFDFDSTLIKVESLELLFEHYLLDHPNKNQILQQIKSITDQGMSGQIGFHESISRRLQLLKAHHNQITEVAQLIKSQHITRSIFRNKHFFQKHSEHIFVISGGFDELTLPTTRFLGIQDDHVFTNQFTYDTQNLVTGLNINNPLSQNQGKIKQLKLLDLPKPIIAIGDGYTDLELFLNHQVDNFILFTENIARSNLINQSPYQSPCFNDLINLNLI